VPQLLSDIQLDALRELSNIGSGTAATSLSSLVGMPVDVSVPNAIALPLADAVDRAGPAEAEVTAVALPVFGEFDALVLIVMNQPTVDTVCELLGVPTDDEMAASALGEVGNILGGAYLGALATMLGGTVEPRPPELVRDMLGAILASALLASGEDNLALLLESTLRVNGRECSPSFMFVPSAGGLGDILSRLGLGA